MFSMPGFSQAGSPAVSCESLAKLTLPNTTITMAQMVAAGELKMTAPECRRTASGRQGSRGRAGGQQAAPGDPAAGQGPTSASSRRFAGFRPRCGPAAKTRPSSRCGCRPRAGTDL